jgi:hypothetical protein
MFEESRVDDLSGDCLAVNRTKFRRQESVDLSSSNGSNQPAIKSLGLIRESPERMRAYHRGASALETPRFSSGWLLSVSPLWAGITLATIDPPTPMQQAVGTLRCPRDNPAPVVEPSTRSPCQSGRVLQESVCSHIQPAAGSHWA